MKLKDLLIDDYGKPFDLDSEIEIASSASKLWDILSVYDNTQKKKGKKVKIVCLDIAPTIIKKV